MRYLTTVLSGLTVLAALQSTPAMANGGDAVLGGLIGGAFGAAVGHQIDGRHGAIVGAALGGATGVALATEQRRNERDVTYRREETRYEQPRYEETRYEEEPRYYEERREMIRVQPRYERRVVIREETPVYYAPRPAPIVYVRDRHWHRHHGWDRDRRDHDRGHDRWHNQPRKKRWNYD